jgi:hypothetical protein
MNSKWMTAVVLLALASVAGCGGCSDNIGGGGGGGGGAGGGCTISVNGSVQVCFVWTNLPTTVSGAYCPTSNTTGGETVSAVSSCPSANSVGSCTFNETINGATYTFVETYYGTTGGTCSNFKQACLGAASSASSSSGATITTSFSGC